MSTKIFRDGAWHDFRYLVKRPNGFREVAAIFVMVGGQWKRVAVNKFTVTATSGHNFSVVTAFRSKYSMDPPAGVTIEVTVPAGVTVLGRAQSKGIDAPPAISFDGLPLDCKCILHVYGTVTGGLGRPGRPTTSFAELQGDWSGQQPAGWANNSAARLASPDAALINGVAVRTSDLGASGSLTNKQYAKVVARSTPASDGGKGGDAVFSDCDLDVFVYPGGALRAGGGGGAGIGHAYTKTFHTPPVQQVRTAAATDWLHNNNSASDDLFMLRGLSDAPKEWHDVSYERYNCRHTSYTLFHGMPGMPGAGAVPLDFPAHAGNDAATAALVYEYFSEASTNSITPDLASLSFAATTYQGVPAWPASALRYQQAARVAASDSAGNAHPYQVTVADDQFYKNAAYALSASLTLTVAESLVLAASGMGYKMPTMAIGGEYYNDDGVAASSAASVADSDTAATWMKLAGNVPSDLLNFGNAWTWNSLTAVSQDTVVTRYVEVRSGKGGGFGAAGSAVTADMTARHSVGATKITDPAGYFIAPAAPGVANNYTHGLFWVLGNNFSYFVRNSYAAVVLFGINYMWHSDAAKWMRSVGMFGRKVASMLAGTVTAAPSVTDVRAYLLAKPYSGLNWNNFRGTLVPTVTKSITRPSNLTVTFRGAFSATPYGTFNSQTHNYSAWTGHAPVALPPGLVLEVECVSPTTTALNFDSPTYQGFAPMRFIGTFFEQAYGSPMGAFAGLPVHACQLSLPGAGGKAAAKSLGSTATLTVTNLGGAVSGGVD